ncbi:polysaccharide pyruvyl transferase family protein [Corynebacterium variabile]|uniref:polysaccharide pyruvyl transferase family protein n=1 Tax=Corynebacterium variabile TaxID=1727 RepID=UPI003F925C72
MTIKLYWWNLRRSPRSLAGEILYNRRSWLRGAMQTHRLFLNFGDEMSKDIVAATFGQKVEWSSAEKANLVAVGSVLERIERAGTPVSVWGTGLRSGEVPTSSAGREMRILAVRGRSTADRLGLGSDIPLGDPGLLAREVFGAAGPRLGIVYVPHFSELAQWGRVVRFCELIGATIVLPTDSPRRVIPLIGAAEVVISASLHGIIVADSYGVPTVPLLPFSGLESPFKYHDYMAVAGPESSLRAHADILSVNAREREEIFAAAAVLAEERSTSVASAKNALVAAARQY